MFNCVNWTEVTLATGILLSAQAGILHKAVLDSRGPRAAVLSPARRYLQLCGGGEAAFSGFSGMSDNYRMPRV